MDAPMKPVVLFLFILFHGVLCFKDDFKEELLLRPLDSGHVYAHFQFTTVIHADLRDDEAFKHYHLFPKALGEVLHKYSVQELHLSQTQGLWRHERWGYPINSAPPGAELWVWFQDGTVQIDRTWTELINVLSGMFCASLNFMDIKSTMKPKYSFRPTGVTTSRFEMFAKHLLRYAAMPRENVCTENLTPWKKLLPCGGKAGLATLFNGIKLFDTNYHSLGVHFRPICQNEDCTKRSMELSQTLSVVFDPTVISFGKQDWHFKKLFGRALTNTCPLSSSSKVYVDTSNNKTRDYWYTLEPTPSSKLPVYRGGVTSVYAVYNIPKILDEHHVFNLQAKYNMHIKYGKITPPVIHMNRFQTGYGQEKGGITSLIYNNDPHKDIHVIFMETVPWYLRVYFHTLKIQNYKSLTIGENGTKVRPLKTHYIPGKDRERSYHLELVMTLPASSVTKVSFQFDRALLKWTEYPPDANHGFYVNSAVLGAVLDELSDITGPSQTSSSISHRLSDNSTSTFIRLHSETLLVTLPTPDFSMPYNVICLACTVVAIAFGSIHNLTTRRFVVQDPSKPTGIKAKIQTFLSKFRKSKKTEENVSESKTENDDVTQESKKER